MVTPDTSTPSWVVSLLIWLSCGSLGITGGLVAYIWNTKKQVDQNANEETQTAIKNINEQLRSISISTNKIDVMNERMGRIESDLRTHGDRIEEIRLWKASVEKKI